MSSATAPPIDLSDAEETEKDRVSLWRCQELRRAGYTLNDALLIAVSHEIDLHTALDLPTKGCPHETALRILV